MTPPDLAVLFWAEETAYCAHHRPSGKDVHLLRVLLSAGSAGWDANATCGIMHTREATREGTALRKEGAGVVWNSWTGSLSLTKQPAGCTRSTAKFVYLGATTVCENADPSVEKNRRVPPANLRFCH